MTKKVTAYLDQRTLTQLDALVRRTGKTKNEIVQEAIEIQWVKAQKSDPRKGRPKNE